MTKWLVGLPLLMLAGAGLGWLSGGAASRLDPTVRLVAMQSGERSEEALAGLSHPERLALERAGREAESLIPRARDMENRFRKAGLGFGIWTGLVVGVGGASLAMVRRRREFEPDRAACLACARCFASCPQERIRLGLAPAPLAVSANPVPESRLAVAGPKSGGCGCGGAS